MRREGSDSPLSRRRPPDDMERRANRALQSVQMGELSSVRQALEGGEFSLGSHATLQALTNKDRRPVIPREPLPQAVIDFVPAVEFNLEDHLFCKILRSARRGAACGQSGMTHEHFGLCCSRSDLVVLHKLGESFAKAQVDAVRMGRVTALR